MRNGVDHPFHVTHAKLCEDENINAVQADQFEALGYSGFANYIRHASVVGPPNLWTEGEALRVENRRTTEALRDLFRVNQDCAEGPLEIEWYRLAQHRS